VRAAAALALALIPLCACTPKAERPPAPPAMTSLDCGLGFEALKAKITDQPGLAAAPKDPGEPYRFYTAADQATSYMITEAGAPGHPAILMEHAAQGHETTTGCPYGDKAGYAKLMAYLDSLKAAHK
jgi:hypothetical protein